MRELRAFQRRHQKIALDTSVFIYQVESNLRYIEFIRPIFSWIEQPGHSAVTSTITMTELLVQPYQNREQQRVDEFYSVLATYPNLEWIAPDLNIADLAAQFRAEYRMRTPDAVQAATAARSQATGLVSNDPIFRRVDAFETLLLDSLV